MTHKQWAEEERRLAEERRQVAELIETVAAWVTHDGGNRRRIAQVLAERAIPWQSRGRRNRELIAYHAFVWETSGDHRSLRQLAETIIGGAAQRGIDWRLKTPAEFEKERVDN